MAKHYKEAPWWWYALVLLGSFILGLIVVLKENVTLPAWAYVVSLLSGIIVSPFVSVLELNIDSQILTRLCSRASFYMLVMAMVLPPIICQK